VIDNDGLSIHSMQSLGRVGRILSGSLEPGALSVNREQPPSQSQLTESPSNNELQSNAQKRAAEDTHSLSSSNSQKAMSQLQQQQQQQQRPIILQEPDVIASTKLAHSKTTDSVWEQKIRKIIISNDDWFFSNFRLHQLARWHKTKITNSSSNNNNL
jgi:hypothetical protein